MNSNQKNENETKEEEDFALFNLKKLKSMTKKN